MEIPVYSLQGILTMNEAHIPNFLRILVIPTNDDNRGQIALTLNRLGKLTYPLPITADNLVNLIYQTQPSRMDQVKAVLRTEGIVPAVERINLMIQYQQMILGAETLSPFPFVDLPTEVQMTILSQLPFGGRQLATVSKGMKNLADTGLMINIRANNLIDPTIGIVERDKYFKLTPSAEGEYFEPDPGLWRIIEAIRGRGSHGEFALMYGELDYTNIIKELEEMESISQRSYNERTYIVRWRPIINSTKFIPGTFIAKFVAIATSTAIDLYQKFLDKNQVQFFTGPRSGQVRDVFIKFTTIRSDEIPIELTTGIITRSEYIEFLRKFSTDVDGHYLLNLMIGPLMSVTPVRSLLAQVRIIPIPFEYIDNGTLILPSLQDDVNVV